MITPHPFVPVTPLERVCRACGISKESPVHTQGDRTEGISAEYVARLIDALKMSGENERKQLNLSLAAMTDDQLSGRLFDAYHLLSELRGEARRRRLGDRGADSG